MKKFFAIVLCASFMMSIAACTATDTNETTKKTKETEETTEETPAVTVPDDFDPDFTFTTVDRDGREYTQDIFAQHELTMVNFWEPWCGPCVREMPDIQRLYKEYAADGFYVLGVYSETYYEYEVDEIIEDGPITYPILRFSSDFSQFVSGAVPTTFFVDRQGHVLPAPDGSNLYVGSKSYDGWKSVITGYLYGNG